VSTWGVEGGEATPGGGGKRQSRDIPNRLGRCWAAVERGGTRVQGRKEGSEAGALKEKEGMFGV